MTELQVWELQEDKRFFDDFLLVTEAGDEVPLAQAIHQQRLQLVSRDKSSQVKRITKNKTGFWLSLRAGKTPEGERKVGAKHGPGDWLNEAETGDMMILVNGNVKRAELVDMLLGALTAFQEKREFTTWLLEERQIDAG